MKTIRGQILGLEVNTLIISCLNIRHLFELIIFKQTATFMDHKLIFETSNM